MFPCVEGAAGPRKLPEGTMLDDKYRIERLLAVGGMGAVYVGTHIRLRKRVAIKILNPQLSSPPMIERFHREAITASQIGHEGIAQVTDLGTSSAGEPFLVMEYLEGESLASRLRTSGPLAVEEACELGCAILSPLAAAHRAGIVHRDLKPDNVFLVRQSRGEMVKLLDFGISRVAGLESEFRLTTTGLVLGTPYYMSPEQARGDGEITTAADIYAFGVMLYEMLIGNVPIRAENYNQLIYRVMMSDFVRPGELRPDLPEGLEQIILAAMAQDAQHRPPSALELERALLVFCRPAVRDRMNGTMSSPALPIRAASPAIVRDPGTSPRGLGTGPRPGYGSDHTVIAGSNASAGAFAARSTQLTGDPLGGVTQPDRPDPAAPRRSKLPWILASVLVTGGIATAIAVGVTRGGPVTEPRELLGQTSPAATQTPPAAAPNPPATQAVAVEPPATATQPAAGDASTPAAATEPARVTLRFAVKPASAVITVDGAQVHAAELVVTKDDAVHKLRITAPGYRAYDEDVRFNETQRLEVHLERATEPGRRDPKRDPERSRNERIDTKSPY
jgi:serine/threonine-protein kinase